MKIISVHPADVVVSGMNERRETPNTGGKALDTLQASVNSMGVIQPPIVREVDNPNIPEGFEVISGSRRLTAAQNADIDSVEVILVDWDDEESLRASIAENIESFRERVSLADRARAVRHLKRMGNYESNVALGEALGVSEATIRRWLEPFRDEWENTELDPEKKEQVSTLARASADSLTYTRNAMGGGTKGTQFLRTALKKGLTTREIREATSKIRAGVNPDVAIEQVRTDRDVNRTLTIRFPSDVASAVMDYAKENEVEMDVAVVNICREYLETPKIVS